MDDSRVGSAVRAVRLRRGWRQSDVALKAEVSAGTVSNLGRGRLGGMSLDAVRRIASVLEIRVGLVARWRGGELDRLLAVRHARLATAVIGMLNRLGWQAVPEVSFSIYGERGFIDLLAWHAPTRSLIVIELKTEVIDAGELLGVLDRKTRLGPRIARDRGWSALTVSTWLVIADSSTNRARVKVLETMLRAALPTRGATMKAWLRRPSERVAGLSFFQNFIGGRAKEGLAGRQRVRRLRPRSHL